MHPQDIHEQRVLSNSAELIQRTWRRKIRQWRNRKARIIQRFFIKLHRTIQLKDHYADILKEFISSSEMKWKTKALISMVHQNCKN